MAKGSKGTRLVGRKRRKTPAKKRVSTKNAKHKALENSPYRHVQDPAQPGVNVMEQQRMYKADDTMIGSVSSEENKNQRLELRLTKRQKDFIGKASRVSGFKNVSDYVLHIAINDSKNVIREQQIFELSERDRVSFMEMLENPPQPGKNLKKAMASYLSFQEGK